MEKNLVNSLQDKQALVKRVLKTPSKNPKSFLAPGWAKLLSSEFEKPYMEKIRIFLKSELQNGFRFFPPSNKIFTALNLVDYPDTRVVILGQDPYHGLGQANGLAFAVESSISMPPSLQNIFKEIRQSYSLPENYPLDRTLIHWAHQGVLCLNTVLTVRENSAFSHREKGWEVFTNQIIQHLVLKDSPLVFLCWGSAASKKLETVISVLPSDTPLKRLASQHLVLKAPHPSPLSAYKGFFGCKHFIKTNEFLVKHQFRPIKWYD